MGILSRGQPPNIHQIDATLCELGRKLRSCREDLAEQVLLWEDIDAVLDERLRLAHEGLPEHVIPNCHAWDESTREEAR